MLSSLSVARSGVTTIAPGRVYALGVPVPLDGRVSWAPTSQTGYEPFHCFLVRSESGAVLIDTGAGAHADLIVTQLSCLLEPGARLPILLTRTELDCALNVRAIERVYDVPAIHYTGGITVPTSRGTERVQRFSAAPGKSIPLEPAPGIRLELVSPMLRLLPVVWPFHPESGTLFSSDAFGHVGMDSPAEPRSTCAGPERLAVERTLMAKFSWLAATDTAPIAADLTAIFAARDVRAIAPTHGCVITGEVAVGAHAAALSAAVAGAAG